MSDKAHDTPNVLVLPPILLLVTIASGVVLDWLMPIGLLAALPAVPRIVVGGG